MNAYAIPGIEKDNKFRSMELFQFSEVVCNYYNLTLSDIVKKSRKGPNVKARSFIMHYACIFTKLSLNQIAKTLSPAITNHATVSICNSKMKALVVKNRAYRCDWIKLLSLYKDVKPSTDQNYSLFMEEYNQTLRQILPKSKEIYICGKVTGEDRTECLKKFNDAALLLIMNGYAPINPMELVDENETWQQAMNICIKKLRVCKGLLMLPDCDDSKGALIEINEADKVGIKSIDISNFINGQRF